MRLSIGGIFAACPACGAEDFQAPSVAALRDVLNCGGCGAAVLYGELLNQIAAQAVARAAAKTGTAG
jgi:hypothetical protein